MQVVTDVRIWHFGGLAQATQRLDEIPKLNISAITYPELLQGIRSTTEPCVVQKSLALRYTKRLPVTSAITERAVGLMENLGLSHSLRLGDALIATTAIEHGLALLTANTKHFAVIAGIRMERFEP